PKTTGGWLFAPPALSDDHRLADITREGYLFEWSTQAPTCQDQWPTFRHDPEDTGNYDFDGTPPNAVSRLRLTRLGPGRYRLTFVAPGDHGPCGTPAAYLTRVNGQPANLRLGTPVAAGQRVTMTVRLGPGARTLTVQAQNRSGVLGYPVSVRVPG